ncbi:20820_t:CDS:2, partial [Dentiscutata erythropus]
MSEYLTNVVKCLQLISKENVNINVIKQTLETLLRTVEIRKDGSQKLMNDYISFYNELNYEKGLLITNMIIGSLLVLFIAMIYTVLQYNKITDPEKNIFNILSYINFCKPINCDRGKCSNHILGDMKGARYFSAKDGYEICGFFLEENPDSKDNSKCSSEEKNESLEHFIIRIFNEEPSYCEKRNRQILQNNETFYEICEYLLENRKNGGSTDLNDKKESENNLQNAISICEQWQI